MAVAVSRGLLSSSLVENMRYALALVLAFCSLHCADGEQSPADVRTGQEARPPCEEGKEERGAWQIVQYPTGLGSDIGVAEGSSFVLLGGADCGFCEIQELEHDAQRWITQETKGFIMSSTAGTIASTSEFLAASNISTHQAASVSYPRTLTVLDRKSLQWNQQELPSALATRHESKLFWTGREFLVFGGNVAKDGARVYQRDTPMASFSDGAFFDPSSATWRLMASAWNDGEHQFGVNPPQGGLQSVWTPEGLFVWGVAPDEAKVRSAIYLVENNSWTHLEPDHGPALRKNAELTYREGFVYLFSGHKPGVGLLEYDLFYSDFWRFSLKEGDWEQLEVPPYVDLRGSKAAWVGGELVFIGHYCANANIYNPNTRTWSLASALNSPPVIDDYGLLGFGHLSSSDDKLFVNNVSVNGVTRVPAVWVLTL